SATEDLSSMQLDVVSDVLTIQFLENLYDSGTVTVIASDGQLSTSAAFNISVAPVNDAPIVSTIDVSTDEGSGMLISLEVEDVDSDSFEIFIMDYPDGGTIGTIDNTALTIEYEPYTNFFGSDLIEYRIYDGVDYSNTSPINIIVNPINDPPELAQIDAQAIDEDTVFTYELVATDVDDTELSYSASVDGNASVDVTESTLTVTPDPNYNGDIIVSVTVSDGEFTDSQSFTLTINPVNDAPELAQIDDQAIAEDTELIYILSASDVDDIELSYSATVDGNASVDVTESTLTVTPDPNY
ncbi:uncharacterized protein METZ01_LOCUS227006, partial [marine metagenome]